MAFRLIYHILRLLLLPIVWILCVVHPKFRKRWRFEGIENLGESKSRKADFAFEVSSEGELQQVLPLIEYVLGQNKKVEILYCSESVTKDCSRLQQAYPEQVHLLSLPILSYFPFHPLYNPEWWINAPIIVFCRYDFFPELFFGRKKKRYLVSGSLKNFESKSLVIRWYLGWCYQKFEKIITNTEKEKNNFKKHFPHINKVKYFDFRVVQIEKRLSLAKKTLNEKMPGHALLNNLLNELNGERVIYGNFWATEVKLLKNQNINQGIHFIVPHKIDTEIAGTLKNDLNCEVYEVTPNTTENDIKSFIEQWRVSKGIWLISLKGILCELYGCFDHAYVGGGFGISVHSLLEPYLAGCNTYCGPKIFRSSEYDWVFENSKGKNPLILENITHDKLELDSHFVNKKNHQNFAREESLDIMKWLIEGQC